MGLFVVPVEQAAANLWITEHHRHLKRVAKDRFRVGVADESGLVGICQVGRPRARMIDQRSIVEVLRCCVVEDPARAKNAVSLLLSRAARAAESLGFAKIITYILECESGSSLRAAGWHMEAAEVGGGEWGSKSRPRAPSEQTGKKQRWARNLNP